MKARLLEIINAGANKLTKDDKIFIKTSALELGIYPPAGSCKSCYIDTAVFLVQEIERQEEQDLNIQPTEVTAEEVETPTEPGTEERKIFIKKGVDIIVNGVRVNRYTVKTDAHAKALMKIIDKKYFEIL
jgi:hypothetical protein